MERIRKFIFLLISFLFAKPEDIKDHVINRDPVPIADQPTVTTAPTPVMKNLNDFCLAIRDFEGQPGDRNYRNNNPGNCRYSSAGYLPIYGTVGRDPQNFAIFIDYETGWLYLKNLIQYKVTKNPNQTLLEFMQVYAPSSDNNDPTGYANFIGKRLRVPTHVKMGDLI